MIFCVAAEDKVHIALMDALLDENVILEPVVPTIFALVVVVKVGPFINKIVLPAVVQIRFAQVHPEDPAKVTVFVVARVKLFCIMFNTFCVMVESPGIVKFQNVMSLMVTSTLVLIVIVLVPGFIVPEVLCSVLPDAPHEKEFNVRAAPPVLLIVKLF
jgi:hypothetical protein